MEVLKVGKNHPDWTGDFECKGEKYVSGCGSILRINRSDLFTEKDYTSMNRIYERIIAICIVCKCRIIIESPVESNWGDIKSFPIYDPGKR